MQGFVIFYSLNIFAFKFRPMRSHLFLIIQSNCSYIFALILDWATVFVKICRSVVEIMPHLVDKLSFDIYLLITVHFCFPKTFFLLISVVIVLMFFLCSSKSHCSFKIVPVKGVWSRSFVIFHQYLCFFLVPLTCIY